MAITTIRPGQDVTLASVSLTGAVFAYVALSNAPVDDTTFVNLAAGQQYPNGYFLVLPAVGATSFITATQRIKQVRFIARVAMNGSAGNLAATIKLGLRRNRDATMDFFEDFRTSQTAPQTLTGVWRTRPPSGVGSEWSAYELGLAQWYARFFNCGGGYGTNLRITELYLDIDVRDRATVTAVTASNTTSSTQPTITWTYSANSDGDPQTGYQVKIFSSTQYSASNFSPDTTPATWDSGQVNGLGSSQIVGTTLNNGVTYRAYVRVAADFNGSKWWSAWVAGTPTTLALTALPIPNLISVTSDTVSPFLRNRLSVQANWNQLSAQDAGFEDSTLATGSWASLFAGGTIARVTSQAAHGAASMSLTKITAIGDMEFLTAGGVTGYQVKPGQNYTALASFKTAVTARSCSVGMAWATRDGTAISNAYGTAITDATGSWQQASYNFTAPAGAVYGSVWVKVAAAAVSEVHYVDKIMVGTNVVIGTGGTGGSGGTTAPVIAAKVSSGYWSGSSKAVSVIGVPAGALLVVASSSGSTAAAASHTVSSSGAGAITWTTRQENSTAVTGESWIATGLAASAGDYTVTIATSGGNAGDEYSIVYIITGHDEVAFGGANAKASATSGAPSVALTTTRENSLVICVNGDYNEQPGGSRAYRAPGGTVTEDWFGDFSNSVVYNWHSLRPTIGAGTEGLTAPTGQAYGLCAIEIRGVTGSSVSQATGWSPGGYVGTASTVVERAVMHTSIRNMSHPNLWSGGDYLKSSAGFFVTGATSMALYDTDVRQFGEGSLRWDVNNLTSSVSFGYPSAQVDDSAPAYVLPGVAGRTYTFGVYGIAKTSAFSTALTLQALDQQGNPIGSPTVASGLTVSTSVWTLMQATLTMPAGAVYVRPTLVNSATVTETSVWLDAVQWVPGSAVDTIVGRGTGAGVIWEAVRHAGRGSLNFSDGTTALTETIYDNEVPPGSVVLYRSYNYAPATTTIPALSSTASSYVSSVIDPPGRGVWIIVDPEDSTKTQRLHVVSFDESVHEEALTVYPLRPTTDNLLGQRGLTISDFVGGQDGTFKALCDSEAEWLALQRVLWVPRVLWLVFPEGGGRFIRITNRAWIRSTDRSGDVPDSVWRRDLSLAFIEADRPAI